MRSDSFVENNGWWEGRVGEGSLAKLRRWLGSKYEKLVSWPRREGAKCVCAVVVVVVVMCVWGCLIRF